MRIKGRNLREMFKREDIIRELESKGLDSNSFDYLYKYLKDNDLLDRLEEYTKRLLDGEAVQYIIGNVCFYGNIINVNKSTLIPRFETELLVEKTCNYINDYFDDKVSILDIGTGSGCIAITLNKLVNSDVMGIDISNEALDVAKVNNRVNNTDVNFYVSDVFDNVKGKFDVIISNPPYIGYDEDIMGIVYNNEPHLALFADDNGLFFYDKILSECKSYLNDRFLIAFEIGYLQADSIVNLVNRYLGDVNIWVCKDYSDRDRFVFITNCIVK